MRIAIDYTPAIRQGAGIGRYTRSLVSALAGRLSDGEELVLWHTRDAEPEDPPSLANDRVQLRRVPLPERVLTGAWHRLHAPFRLEHLIGSVDVVHGPDFVIPPTSAPAVVTIHDLSYIVTPEYAHPALRRYLMQAVPRALERAAGIVAVSETTASDLVEHYHAPRERITVIPNGVDPRFHPPSQEEIRRVHAKLEVRRPYFLTVGTIEPRKNHRTLLEAFAQVYAAFPEASLLIVGRHGWLADPIVAEIDAAARRLPVRLLSRIDDRLLPGLYAGSTALVYPSWYEGFGLPVVEAMASGAAVITSDHGALAEVAGDAALLVSAGDADKLAEQMCRVLEDTALREDLVQRGRARAAQFTWEAAAEAHLALYRRVMAER